MLPTPGVRAEYCGDDAFIVCIEIVIKNKKYKNMVY